jgi:hypothetical protein
VTTTAISGVVATLEEAWGAIQENHPELPDVVIIIASGHESKQRKFGHFASHRWNVDGDNHHEIMVSGEGLKRGAGPVMTTLLHEAAHTLADARGVQDTSRQGRYHNKVFKALATEVGIQVEKDARIGWSVSEMGELGSVRYAKQIVALDAVLTLYRNSRDELAGLLGGKAGGDGDDEPKEKKKTTVLAVCACDPPRKVRMSPATLTEGSIQCGNCEQEFGEQVD